MLNTHKQLSPFPRQHRRSHCPRPAAISLSEAPLHSRAMPAVRTDNEEGRHDAVRRSESTAAAIPGVKLEWAH